MKSKLLLTGCGLMILILLTALPVLAEEKHKGKLVSAGAGKLTMTDLQGQNQHTHDVPADTTILCGKTKCALEDLKAGQTVVVTMEKKGDQTVIIKIKEKMGQKTGS